MSLTVILFVMIIVLPIIVGGILSHRNRDWMIEHFGLPEIMFLETSEERKQVSKQAFRKLIRNPVSWILLLSYATVGTLIVQWIKYPTVFWFKELTSNDEINKFLFFLFILIPLLSPMILLIWHERRWMRKYLRTYLNEHGKPICMKCGYDLRGLEEHRCPECGKSFE